jgi:hypothetical protein
MQKIIEKILDIISPVGSDVEPGWKKNPKIKLALKEVQIIEKINTTMPIVLFHFFRKWSCPGVFITSKSLLEFWVEKSVIIFKFVYFTEIY